MEKNGNPVLPQKFSSFSSSGREEKLRESDRNLSLGNIKLEPYEKKELDLAKNQIKEEDEEGENGDEETKDENASHGEDSNTPAENEPDFATLSEEVDQFLASLTEPEKSVEVPEIPESVIDKFLDVVEKEVQKYENVDERWVPEHDDLPLLPAIGRVLRLSTETEKFCAEPKYAHAMNRAGGILHLSMALLEEEFYLLLLEDPHVDSHRAISFGRNQEPDRCVLPPTSTEGEGESNEPSLPYPSEIIERLQEIATTMISAGYSTECCQIFSIARRNAFESSLLSLGFERPSIDDLVRMAWEPLEGEIATWIKVFKHAMTKGFPLERDLANKVFNNNKSISTEFFQNLVRESVLHLLNFPEAMFMTKCSAEKLFKMLDIYETLKDSEIVIESFFPEEDLKGEEEDPTASYNLDLKSEIASVRSHIGESARAIFCDLERSIKADSAKTPVPGGAVHPLTRYVMNYLKYACEYKNTLEEIFREHHKTSCDDDEKPDKVNNNKNSDNPFAAQLVEVMDLLNSNLDMKSKLYKDLSLSYIFLMNNGRYITQKIKGSEETCALLGETWIRNRSADVRNYHKNYQRETWSRVLNCLRNDGLMVKGSVQKPVLKERFKSFNSMFEEIHRAQSTWVVSDEQLKSELRVSIQAVVVQAYRSFKGRFEQHFSAGRQTEKYIKYSVEDLERHVDELFEGTPASIVKRR
ncbi:hypothetical protein LUZ61_007342 [Rhynchospora tenuis]|uniref:Exocyst subunit Exo70 family protein n=1 Tax=Rhynchospora tenuis TaxID=198213 RepID=A0AAD5ZT67_9POAL|nr:hypothetical protein LUZ61_007342 [Rhynchospora tenuis]